MHIFLLCVCENFCEQHFTTVPEPKLIKVPVFARICCKKL